MARNIDQLNAVAPASTTKLIGAEDGQTELKRFTVQALQNLIYSSQPVGSVKDAVVVATTANIALTGEQTIDGVLTAASRVLVKNQSAPAQNGIYVSAAGAWSRATDADTWAELPGSMVAVQTGSASADSVFIFTVDAGGTLGTTAITVSKMFGGNLYQPYSAKLSQFTGSWVADRFHYTTSTSALALATLTAFARTLLDDANAAAGLTTLGVSAYMQTVLDDTAANLARVTLGITHETIAQSGTPVAHTGTTAETVIATAAIPPLAAGDMIEITHGWAWTSSANTKVPRIRYNTTGNGLTGTIYHGGTSHTTNTFLLAKTFIFADSTSAQRGSPVLATSFGTSTAGVEITSAISTVGLTELVFTMQLGSAAETATLKFFSVQVIKKPV
jgi:hypothetical protein